MDLVRLGLERARSADEAVGIMTDLLTTHGQGGIADAVRQEAYDSSFLIADPAAGLRARYVGHQLRRRPFPRTAPPSATGSPLARIGQRGRPTSIPGEDFERFRDRSKRTGYADVRLAASRSFLAGHAYAAA